MSDQKDVAGRPADSGREKTPDPSPRRSRFGTAADGWDAYNGWLDRVRNQAGPTSRQAVIAKALYSVSSYRNWADKARDAFDKKD